MRTERLERGRGPAPQGGSVHLGGNRVNRPRGKRRKLRHKPNECSNSRLVEPGNQNLTLQEFFGIVGRISDFEQVVSSQSYPFRRLGAPDQHLGYTSKIRKGKGSSSLIRQEKKKWVGSLINFFSCELYIIPKWVPISPRVFCTNTHFHSSRTPRITVTFISPIL